MANKPVLKIENEMDKNNTSTRISKTLIIAWAMLLVFVLGILTWVAVAPKHELRIHTKTSAPIDLQLPDAMPLEEYILKDKETKEDIGGAASNTHEAPAQVVADTRPAFQKYAGKPVTDTKDKIKVAFIFSDLGRNEDLLNKIIETTPAGITLAYLPSSADLKNKITTARQKGHEILLNIPMEPTDYPNTDSGPNTLLTGLAQEKNIERLNWTASQGHEFIGFMNFQGSLFLSSHQDLEPVLNEIKNKGMVFVEAEACFRSQASEAAEKAKLPHIKSHFVLSESLTPTELHAILIRAEQLGKESGNIIIVAHASPITAPTLLTWISKAQELNYAFEPISQAMFASSPENKAAS